MGNPVGLGPPGEKDFNEPLRLVVVAEDVHRAAAEQARLSPESEVRVCAGAGRLRHDLHQEQAYCVVLILEDSEDADTTLLTVLSSVSDEPVVVVGSNRGDAALRAIYEGAQDYLLEA